MSATSVGSIICPSLLLLDSENVGISVKPVLKLVVIAAAGALLAKNGKIKRAKIGLMQDIWIMWCWRGCRRPSSMSLCHVCYFRKRFLHLLRIISQKLEYSFWQRSSIKVRSFCAFLMDSLRLNICINCTIRHADTRVEERSFIRGHFLKLGYTFAPG